MQFVLLVESTHKTTDTCLLHNRFYNKEFSQRGPLWENSLPDIGTIIAWIQEKVLHYSRTSFGYISHGKFPKSTQNQDVNVARRIYLKHKSNYYSFLNLFRHYDLFAQKY